MKPAGGHELLRGLILDLEAALALPPSYAKLINNKGEPQTVLGRYCGRHAPASVSSPLTLIELPSHFSTGS